MDEVDPDLAHEIRNLRFTFEDILNVDDAGVQMLLKEINQEDLLVALKTASEELKDKIFNNNIFAQRASANGRHHFGPPGSSNRQHHSPGTTR